MLSISAIILSKTIDILRFLFGMCSAIFFKILSVSFQYSKKVLESLKRSKLALSPLLIKI